MPSELWEAQTYRVLCADWGYPGLLAAKRAPVEMMRVLRVLDMADTDTSVPVQAPTDLKWDAPEHITADDLTRAEILAGAGK